MLAFVIKAVVAALKKFPQTGFASLGGRPARLRAITTASARPAGAPNEHDGASAEGCRQEGHPADQPSEMGELAKKARDGKLGRG